MRIFSFLSYAITICSLTRAFQLTVESDNLLFKGLNVTSLHQEAGVDYLYLDSTTGVEFSYDSREKFLYLSNAESYRFSIDGNNLAKMGVKGADRTDIEVGYFFYDGFIEGFYACNNIKTSYQYNLPTIFFAYDNKAPAEKDCSIIRLKVA